MRRGKSDFTVNPCPIFGQNEIGNACVHASHFIESSTVGQQLVAGHRRFPVISITAHRLTSRWDRKSRGSTAFLSYAQLSDKVVKIAFPERERDSGRKPEVGQPLMLIDELLGVTLDKPHLPLRTGTQWANSSDPLNGLFLHQAHFRG